MVTVTDFNRLTTSLTTSSLVVQLVRQPGCRYELYSQPRLATSCQLVANQLAKWNLALMEGLGTAFPPTLTAVNM